MNLWNNQNNNASNSLTEGFNLVETIFGIGLFLSPFFFLPFTYDFVELNKAYLYMYVAALAFLAFAFQGYKKGSLYIKSLRYYLPFLFLLAGGILSVYFSTNIRNSLFGSSGSFMHSFIVLIAYCLIAFVAVNTKLNVRNLVHYFFFGVLISAVVAMGGFYSGIVAIYAKFLPSTLLADSYGSLLAMLVFSGVLSFYFLFFGKKTSGIKPLYYLMLIVSLTYLIVLPSFYALLALALGLGYLALTQKEFEFNKHMVGITAISVIVLVIAVLHYLPPIKNALGFNPINEYPRLDVVSSWYVAATSMVGRPFWGNGMNNYATALSQFRPAYLNAGDFWVLRYNYPFNDVFMWLTTGGLAGLFGYVLFMVFVLGKTLDKREFEGRDNSLSVIIMLIFISTFLLGTSTPLMVLFFIVAAVMFQNNRGSVFALKSGFPLVFVLSLSVILIGLLSYRAYGVYASQYYLTKSFRSQNILDRYDLQRAALRSNPTDSAIYREAILTNLAIANRLAAEKDLTDEQKNNIQNLLTQAMNDAAVITEVLDPLNSLNWEVRGLLNKSLIGLDGEDKRFSTIAAQSYANAINRDPSNPLLRIELGNIFYQNKDYANAANYFAQAIQLKNDYANSYYNLAIALKDAGDYENALVQMRVVERLVAAGTPDAEKVKKEIEDLTKQAEANKNKSASVALPDSVKAPEVDAAAQNANQTVTGPEESGSFNLQNDTGVDVEPVSVNKEVPSETQTQTDNNAADEEDNAE